jgi:hypothetical protein
VWVNEWTIRWNFDNAIGALGFGSLIVAVEQIGRMTGKTLDVKVFAKLSHGLVTGAVRGGYNEFKWHSCGLNAFKLALKQGFASKWQKNFTG